MRKQAGYTQLEFAAELVITRRIVAYHEGPNATLPAHLLPQMAKLQRVSADALLGTTPPKRMKALATNRLERRLMEIEKLDAADKRQVLQIIDAFIEKGQLKRKVQRAA